MNVKNVLDQRDFIPAGIVSSSANTINVNDPRVAYYGWTDPNRIPTIYQTQDPREVALSLSIDF